MRQSLAIALQQLGFLRPAEQLSLFDRLQGVDDLRRLTARELLQDAGRPWYGEQFDVDAILRETERIQQLAAAGGCSIVHFWEDRMPALLRQLAQPPLVLYYRGQL